MVDIYVKNVIKHIILHNIPHFSRIKSILYTTFFLLQMKVIQIKNVRHTKKYLERTDKDSKRDLI
jgi:hypothetical protein